MKLDCVFERALDEAVVATLLGSPGRPKQGLMKRCMPPRHLHHYVPDARRTDDVY
jgi:hypothetical protein